MTLRIDAPTVDRVMDWTLLVQHMHACHLRPKPEAGDTLVRIGANAIFTRTAGIEGLGYAVKAVTIFPGNAAPVPSIQGDVLLFDKDQGQLIASINAAAETRWKTAGDSALGSKLLSREDSRSLLMIGAGTMSEPLDSRACGGPAFHRARGDLEPHARKGRSRRQAVR